ncbi:SAF domain-containing protein [Viridibacillus arvi]|uniref:SAF domain-containing protein n=1 Tax=Viridibacillus arvi TaxID=263475 RepID=UPI003D2A65A9
MGIRLRTKKLINAGLAGAGIMLVVSSVGGYVVYSNAQENAIKLKQEYKQEIADLEKVAASNKTVYSLTKDVKKGDKITESMVEKVYVPAAAAPSDSIRDSFLEMNEYYAKTELKAKTVLSDAVLYEEENIENDVREAEYAFIELPSKLVKEEYVDVRIQFPSGDDYVLLTKKKIKNVLGLTVWLNIDEGEILTMSSAIVDAYIEGAKIYAIKYVDEHMQTRSQMTYPVKMNVQELIKESPNVVDIAKLNLEQQNRKRLNATLSELGEDDKQRIKSGNTATKAAITENEDKRSEEERINALNEASQEDAQNELVSGSSLEGVGK